MIKFIAEMSLTLSNCQRAIFRLATRRLSFALLLQSRVCARNPETTIGGSEQVVVIDNITGLFHHHRHYAFIALHRMS